MRPAFSIVLLGFLLLGCTTATAHNPHAVAATLTGLAPALALAQNTPYRIGTILSVTGPAGSRAG